MRAADPADAAGPAPSRFHLALSVTDLDAARGFYVGVLGCAAGACGPDWQIFDFFGHKLTVTLDPAARPGRPVHEDPVALRHFGAVLSEARFHALAGAIDAAGVAFLRRAECLAPGSPRQQWVMLLRDPCGNALEFIAVTDPETLFHPG